MTKFTHLKNNCRFNEGPKAFFPYGGGPNLILGIGRENQIFFLRTPATVKFFPQSCQKWHFGVKKNSFFPCGGGSNLILGIGRE